MNFLINRTYVRKIENYFSIKNNKYYMLEAVNSKTKAKILRFMAANKGREFTMSELANCAGISKSRASEVLRLLENKNLVLGRRVGKSIIYSLNLKNKDTQNVLSFITKSEEKIDKIVKEFVNYCKEKFSKNLLSVVLFGSYARGTYKETSDIDILVVSKRLPKDWTKRKKLFEQWVRNIFEKYEKYVEIVALTEKEFVSNLKNINSFMITFLIAHKVYFGSKFFEIMLKNFAKNVVKSDFVYYEGEKKWELKEEAIRYL